MTGYQSIEVIKERIPTAENFKATVPKKIIGGHRNHNDGHKKSVDGHWRANDRQQITRDYQQRYESGRRLTPAAFRHFTTW